MSSDTLISVENVSKKFCRSLKRALWYGVRDIGNELLGRSGHHPQLRPGEFWAVDDVSFKVRRGECLGLIGPNGAGKSTLLKMLNGLIKPDRGQITMRGRVGALIELGTGFNPILTGRENIYSNAAVLGLPKQQVDKKLDGIIHFAELPDDAIDAPVQSYSSGMKVRLGFAVAAHLDPDVLLIDEVLAVGDIGFRWKCYNVIDRLLSRAAVVFVSHNMEAVTRVANAAVLINNGRPTFEGDPVQAASRYSEQFHQDANVFVLDSHKLLDFSVKGAIGAVPVPFADDLYVTIAIESPHRYTDLLLKISFTAPNGQLAAEYSSRNNGARLALEKGVNRFSIVLREIRLLPQKYGVSFTILHNRSKHLFWCRNLTYVTISGDAQGHQPYQLGGKLTYCANTNVEPKDPAAN